MPGATTKYALPYSTGSDVGSTIDDTMEALANAVEALVDQITPAGSIIATARATAPTGWAICNGTSVLRAGTYANLFTAIGTAFGAVDGTHFNLPDLRGRVPVGTDPTGLRIAAGATLGTAIGEEKHTLTIAELPSHSHGLATVPTAGSGLAVANSGSGGPFTLIQANGTGNGTPHSSMQPALPINWLIKF